jgi:hypothetical protein
MSTLDTTGSTLPPNTSTLTVTDKHAAKDVIKNLVETQPTLAHEHRCNLGHITAAERNLMGIAKERNQTHHIEWNSAEHDLAANSPGHQNLLYAISRAVDGGARDAAQSLPGPTTEFGSDLCARAEQPPPGYGPAIRWTFNGLNAEDTAKTTQATQAASQLNHLSEGGSSGTTARLIKSKAIDATITETTLAILPPHLQDYLFACACARGSSSQSEVCARIRASATPAYAVALKAVNPKSNTCTLCNRHEKDNREHTETSCNHAPTRAGLNARDALCAEAIARTGPCQVKSRYHPYQIQQLHPKPTDSTTTRIQQAIARCIPEPIDTAAARAILEEKTLPEKHRKTLESLFTTRHSSHGHALYNYGAGRGDGRCYANQAGVQRLKSNYRATIGNHLTDLDLDCSHPSMLIDACRRLLSIPAPPHPPRNSNQTHGVLRRELSADYSGGDYKEGIAFGKQLTNAFVHGQSRTSTDCFEKKANIAPMPHHPTAGDFRIRYESRKKIVQPDDLLQVCSSSGPTKGRPTELVAKPAALQCTHRPHRQTRRTKCQMHPL